MDSVSGWLTALGPYFAAESYAAAETGDAPGSPWQSMSVLLDDPGVTAARVEDVRARLGAMYRLSAESVESRVAASVMQLGLAARLLSPLFALAAAGYRVQQPSLRALLWQPVPSSMFALSIPGLDHLDHVDRVAQARDAGTGLEPVAVELCEILRPFHVSPRILLGNVASALNGARIALSAAEPRLAPRARAELDRLLAEPLLAGTSQVTADGRFRRRSCCLNYRIAPDGRGPLCGDCVLAGPRHRQDSGRLTALQQGRRGYRAGEQDH